MNYAKNVYMELHILLSYFMLDFWENFSTLQLWNEKNKKKTCNTQRLLRLYKHHSIGNDYLTHLKGMQH